MEWLGAPRPDGRDDFSEGEEKLLVQTDPPQTGHWYLCYIHNIQEKNIWTTMGQVMIRYHEKRPTVLQYL
jgi:hypothetical protein